MPALVPFGVVLSGGGSPIDLDGTFFLQMAIFFAAFFILKSLVFGPVMKVMDARTEAVDGAREDAARMNAEIAEKKADFESKLRAVKQEQGRERELQRAEAQKLARELTDKARTESARTLSAAKARLDSEAASTRETAKQQVPALAKEIAAKLLDRSVA